MPRPVKCRRVCGLPRTWAFQPADGTGDKVEPIVLTVDEFETVRLIDKEGLSQEECGKQMEVARTTVQQIYTSARKKLALVLVDGLPLVIQGGEYRVCDGTGLHCRCGFCQKRRCALEGGPAIEEEIP